jgi:hypothetical protein
MLQRQLRVGDIVDDYCPRERRLTDHAIVAMVEDTVRQTRCTTCDAEHEYKGAKVPVSRKKKGEIPLPPRAVPVQAGTEGAGDEETADVLAGATASDVVESAVPARAEVVAAPSAATAAAANPAAGGSAPVFGHDGPVHRRLIRATLPRVEGQEVTRPIPEFTMHRVPAGRGGFQGRGFKQGAGNQHRSGGRSAQGSGGFGSRGHGGGQGQGRGGNRPQGGQGGHRGHGAPSGSGRRKKH